MTEETEADTATAAIIPSKDVSEEDSEEEEEGEEFQDEDDDDSENIANRSEILSAFSEFLDDDEDDDDESILTTSTTGDGINDYIVDHYDEASLPPYACRYCGIHDPASVAKCIESNKWFCNATCTGGGGSHLVHHLVRSRSNQVQLHPESPLGDTVLECYNCGCKNVFVMGFVPASSSSVVVLLCRVCVETVPELKDMDWELGQWHPLVQDRKFLPWLVKVREAVLLYIVLLLILLSFVLMCSVLLEWSEMHPSLSDYVLIPILFYITNMMIILIFPTIPTQTYNIYTHHPLSYNLI